MEPERRRSPRKKPDQLASVDLEADNVAIVLDASEGGLSFQAATPVEQSGPFRFLFSLEAADRMEATGELAWTDETKRVGGLRFTHLPEDARELIRKWVARSTMPMTLRRGPATSVAPPNESSGFTTSEQIEHVVPAPNAPRQHDVPSPKARASTLVPTALGIDFREPEDTTEQRPDLGPRPAHRAQFIRGLITGILVSVLLAAAFLFHTYRREVGGWLIRSAERTAPKSNPQTVSPAPAAIPASSSPAADAASDDKTKTEGASTRTAPTPVAPAPVKLGPRASQSGYAGRSELAVAQQYLRGTNGGRDAAAAARLLWAAVTRGNTTAEVMLADLYRRGDGVTKNCDQARVLLIAASRRGNVKAMDKLRELNANGCL